MIAREAPQATASATLEDTLAAIAAVDDPAIWIARAEPAALRTRAAGLDALDPAQRAARPLFGMPFAVKDNIDVAGLPTTAGCPRFAYAPERSATVVERLEAAGATALGKTNLDQFATGLVGTRSPYGTPRNPFDPRYIPGGSSSGSAVAVARGLVRFALGTDTAGSGRVPAGFTGTFGLKPTFGTLSAAGVVPACRSLDCVSIFTRTLDDAEAVFGVARGFDPRDAFSRDEPLAPPPPGAVRFGVPRADALRFFGDVEAEQSFARSARRLGPAASVDLGPFFAAAALLYDGPFVAERTAAVGDFIDAHPGDVLDVTRTIVAGGRAFSATDVFAAQERIRELRAEVRRAFAAFDVLVVPTTPTIFRLDEIAADPFGPNAILGTYTNFVNLLDLCALAIPTGRYANGIPIGITLIAPALHEATLFAAARALAA